MSDMFDFLDESEKELFSSILGSLKDYRQSKREPKQIREIVPIEKWVNDEYYVGESGLSLYPYWKNVLIDIFNGKRNISEIIIDGALGCRPIGTKYHTSKGYLSLEEISRYNDIYILSPDGKKKIVDCHNVGIKDTVKVTFNNGYEMEATTDHTVRVLTRNGIEWCRFDSLTPESNVIVSRIPEGYDGEIYNYDKSYLMGFIYGDGYVTICNGVYSRIGIMSNIADSNHDYVVEQAVKYIGGEPHDYTKSETFTYTRVEKKNPGLISEWEGIGHADDKKIPDWFFSKSLEDKRQFLSGLFDTDGYIGTNGVELTLNSIVLIEQVSELLKEFGIYSTINYCEGEKRNRLHIQGKSNWKKLNNELRLRVNYKRDRLQHLSDIPYTKNERTFLYGMEEYLVEAMRNRKYVAKRNSLESKYKNFRYGKQKITLETLTRFREETSWGASDDVVNKLIDLDSYIIRPVKFEYDRKECGDIEVEGHEYINEGIWQHNTGKSTIGNFMIIRKLYELSCYENIPGLFGLMPGTIISFLYFSVSKTQAELTGFGQLKNIIDRIPYFKEHFPRNERISSILLFPENIMILFGSEQSHAIGMSMIGSILDEANFRVNNAQISSYQSSDNIKVSTMYSAIMNRARSRFLANGIDSSLSILISSNTTSSSFTEERKKQTKDNPNTYQINARVWDVKPKGTYSDKGFYVFVGSDVLDPCIVENVEDLWIITDSWNLERSYNEVEVQIKETIPDAYKEYFTWVPNDFKRQFIDNIVTALQDISGYSVAPSGRLFSSRPAYVKACSYNLEHPFTKDVIVLSTQDKSSIRDFIRKDYFPMNRHKPRYLHFDQSLAHDRTGIASTYLHHVERDEDTGQLIPIYCIEFQLVVAPPKPPAKISIRKCMDIVYYMRDVWHLTIGCVSYDSYSSSGALQDFEEAGIKCELQSVDRDETQYMYLVECLLRNQIMTYKHRIAEKELFDLIYYRDKHKVDHPKAYYGTGENSNQTWGGSKDLTDGMCGSLWLCRKYEPLGTGVIEQFVDDKPKTNDDIFDRVVHEEDLDYLIV